MELQVGVKILFKNNEGKFLLVRRNPEKYPEVGAQWEIVGGRITAGSPLLENLKREILEEIGLDYNVIPKLIAAQDILRATGKHVVRLTYLGKLEGNPKLSEEHLDAKWFTADEVKSLDRKMIDSYFLELIGNGAVLK